MKLLQKLFAPMLKLFDVMRPLFDEKKGIFRAFKTVFETAEFIFFYPKDRTKNFPHVRDPLDLKRYMLMVLIAMAPCIAAAVFFFGPRVLLMILVSYAAGAVCEVGFAIIRKGEIHEGFFVTGMIFPLIMPPSTPLWIIAVGVFFGCFFGKEVFGGTGRNIFNPALVGRIFVTVAFTKVLGAAYDSPLAWLRGGAADAVTTATPMALFKTQGIETEWWKCLIGYTGGSIGETFALGIIAGGAFLVFTKIVDWRVPAFYLGTVLFLSAAGQFIPGCAKIAPPLFQLFGGGLLFGAMFMATDPVTSPFTEAGRIVFGIGCGVLTVAIRAFSGLVEGVMFSIVIMNAFVPLIDSIVLSVKYKETRT
jgi:Na+-transporting NADH:ubiquinone oxidoreductase subunit B/electron transport complex protein RnfD